MSLSATATTLVVAVLLFGFVGSLGTSNQSFGLNI